MIKNGCIPKNITIFSNGKSKPYRWWEDLGSEEVDQMVIKAFAVDSSSKDMLETARRWAENIRDYNKESGTYVKRNELKVEELENKPFTGVKILGLEHRGNGGRAYKVITPGDYYFDLREEVLLDTLINEGVAKGGELQGSFVWGKVGSQMKLVRVDSKLYNELSDAGDRRSMKKVGAKELKVGRVYESKAGKKAIFLGWVSTIKIIGSQICNNANYHYSAQYSYSYSFNTKEMNKCMLWFNLYGYGNKKPDVEFDEWLNKKENTFNCEIRTSHTMVREVGEVVIPGNIFEIIKNTTINYMFDYIDRNSYYSRDADSKFYSMSGHSEIINMVEYGKTPKIHTVYNGMKL